MSGGLNGAAKAVYTAIGAAATVMSVIAGILFKNVADTDARHEREIALVRDQAQAERTVIEARLQKQLDEIARGRIENAERIRALESAIVEIETQFRAMATANNLERQMAESINDLLQQCPACKVPQRTYYPPGPGPNGTNGKH